MCIINELAQSRTAADDRDSQAILAPLGTCVGRSDAPASAAAPPREAGAARTAPLLATLAQQTQARLRAIGAGHQTEFGTNRRLQATFDAHVGFFDALIARGASHQVIGQLLAEVGIAGADGAALPLGTVSGALSRARERARAAGATAPDRPTSPPLQASAAPRRPPQGPAGPRRSIPAPAEPAPAPGPTRKHAPWQPRFLNATTQTPPPRTRRTSSTVFGPDQQQEQIMSDTTKMKLAGSGLPQVIELSADATAVGKTTAAWRIRHHCDQHGVRTVMLTIKSRGVTRPQAYRREDVFIPTEDFRRARELNFFSALHGLFT